MVAGSSSAPKYCISSHRSDTGGWDAQDHFVFQAIVDQYPRDLTNRRTLYIDRLRRHLQHKTRADVVRIYLVSGNIVVQKVCSQIEILFFYFWKFLAVFFLKIRKWFLFLRK